MTKCFLGKDAAIAFMFVSLLGLFLYVEPTWAEVWLANRYAQNCAACHAPGRWNKEPVGRRCTLSCQGCHVNPNGGGMRNLYGKWVQDKWLYSVRSKTFKDHYTPAPVKSQTYMPKNERRSRSKAQRGRKGRSTRSSRTARSTRRRGVPVMRSTTVINPPLKYYDYYTWNEWKKNSKNEAHFLSTVPVGDPYREERKVDLYTSGDFRYLFGQGTRKVEETNQETDLEYSFGMAFDLGVRLKPLSYHQVSFVVESRFMNGPTFTQPEDTFTRGAQVRSAYVLVDDLWYNTYVQAGLYRPMFGHMTPDHTSLAQKVSRFSMRSVYKAVGIGAAPNVPFGIINIIQPISNEALNAQDEGFVAALGARAVTMGLSGTLSYWDTKKAAEQGGNDSVKKMTSFAVGGMLGDFILNADALRVDITENGARNAGTIFTAEAKYRIWREMYLLANYATSNVAVDLSPGQAQEYMFGLKAFIVGGTELETLMITRRYDDGGVITNENVVQVQAHLFWYDPTKSPT